MQPNTILVQQGDAAVFLVPLILTAARALRHAGSAHLCKAETALQAGVMTGRSCCAGLD